ncbi:alpha/beta hydrolase-fold protein [Flagellimonas pacifica]|uniref:Predicted hydrolase of the alpha/beta superfamily n=1 Tax=Flagellimonas pacifica TaxID=1247520 RepID=A0A285MRK9_9FLAO|nr:alpha/beta hydrolase-fold protein [Allomuricauda parva]SNY99795.1 Predicted hydrolase of the alpha/beta superfamily [Allomuricauda parva]
MKSFFVFIICCFVNIVGIAQENNSPIAIGIKQTIKSSILNEDRTIQIYTPDGYSDSKKEYPVLYILDGQWYFLSGVSIQKALRTPGAIPEMIIVGIHDNDSSRWTLFGDESEKFTDFFVNEVIHYIDSNYRTNKERVVFGWEAAAYYISELILKKSDIFNGAIITDGGYASEELVKKFTSNKDIYLFMANSRKDIYYIGSTDAFYEILKKNNPKNLIWKYSLFNNEVHETLAHLAMYKGLKYYYHNYDSPVFESIQQYVDLGGMDYLTTYFKERTKRFGGDSHIDDNTKNGLIWLAWNRNNFEYFNIFMTEFKDVLTTKRYDSAYWQNRFGQFYLKHKDYHNAIKYFSAGLTKYPNSNFEKEMKQGVMDAESRKD